MSSNQKLCSRCASDLRQSYSNRICDDLSEVILQFLSFEYKVQLESVSKQFQRTIFSKVTEFPFDFIIRYDIRPKYLDALLCKMANIERLVIPADQYNDHYFRNIAFELIIQNYKHLTVFWSHSSLNFLRRDTKQRFFQKFSPQLVDIRFYKRIENISLESMVNIEELLFEYFPPELPRIKLKRLKSLKIFEIRDKHLDQLIEFLEINGNTLKHLELEKYDMSPEEEDMKSILKTITKMNNLVDLSIDSFIGINDKRMATLWSEISQKCHQLKRLHIPVVLNSVNMESMNEFLSPLRQLKALKRLDIYFDIPDDEEEEDDNIFSFEYFKGFENLTHLTIVSNSECHEFLFTDIDINLPNLQSLEIRDVIEVNEESVGYLTRLSRLETIKLNITDKTFVSYLKTQLQYRCDRIKTIDISFV